MKKVRIKPKTQWAKNRVNEHGEIFEYIEVKNKCLLAKSLGKTWNKNTEHWMGWFTRTCADWEGVK